MANPGTPTLNSPISGVQISDNTPTLSFQIPSDSDNDDLVFQCELDTNSSINTGSSDYKKFESRYNGQDIDQGNWQYDPGSGFESMPSGGIDSSAYTKTATMTVPASRSLRNAIWYWRISVSDQLSTVLFGTSATFGCNKFG